MYSIELTLPDGTRTFRQKDALPLGDYVGAHVGQHNLVARDPNGALTVFFRPDVSGHRMEIVVEWGDIWGASPSDLPAYTAKVLKHGQAVASIDVPAHYWLTRWRWQSAPRNAVRTPAQIFDAKLLPEFRTLNVAQKLPQLAPPCVRPMDTSNVYIHMPDTGDRYDIGLQHEYAAAYLATDDAGMLSSTLAWAEASGAIGWHPRDRNTNCPINWQQYPNACLYGQYSTPSLQDGMWPQWMSKNPAIIAGNHAPSLAYLARLLTDDPYLLEEVQFQATWMVAATPWNGPKIIRHDEGRAFAWGLRDLFHAWAATPDAVPPWLLPKSYWKDILDANRDWLLDNYVNSTEPKIRTFSSGVAQTSMKFWQENFLATVLLSMVPLLPDWLPILQWKIQGNLNRCSETSGWPKQLSDSTYDPVFLHADGTLAKDWPDLYSLNQVTLPPDGSLWFESGTNYQQYARGVMALAAANNIVGASEAYQWLDEKVQQLCAAHANPMAYRWAF